MKAHFKNIILFVSLSFLVQINSLHLSQNNPYQKFLPSPPAANDLANHFGSEPNANLFGPQNRNLGALLPREGIIPGQPTPITMITNFNKEINPSQVVSGNLNNSAYDAGKIIKAEIASKLKFSN
jgi:hypothetical protein